MFEVGRTYASERGTRLTVTGHEPGRRLEWKRRLPPRTGRANPHLHLDFDQRFEIVSGEGRAVVEGEDRTVAAGDVVELPTGTRHADPWTEASQELVYRATVAPAPRFVEVYAATLAHQLEHGGLDDQDEFEDVQLLVILRDTRARSFRADLPMPLQRIAVPIAAAIGRARGYRPLYDSR